HRALELLERVRDGAGHELEFERRVRGAQARERRRDAFRYSCFVMSPGAIDVEADGRTSVEQRGLRAVGSRILNGRHLVEPHMTPSGQCNRERSKVGGFRRKRDRADRLLRPAELAAATGGLLLNLAQAA